MAPAAEALTRALAETPMGEPAFPVLSNGSTRPFEDMRAELAENLFKPRPLARDPARAAGDGRRRLRRVRSRQGAVGAW